MISICIPSPIGNIELLRDCITSFVQCSGKDIEFIISANNWDGFERPCNAALRLAKGEFILLANDDVVMVDHEWEQKVLGEFHRDEKIGLVGHAGTRQHDGKRAAYWFVVFRKTALDDVGLLDESFETFSSDHDHCLRLSSKGWKLSFVHFPIVHKMSASVKKLPNHDLLIAKNRERFKQKWGFY